MYLYLAIFWLVLGVMVQVFWDAIEARTHPYVGRGGMGIVFFILFSYNFFRWRLAQSMQRRSDEIQRAANPPHHDKDEYNPAFDFSKDDPKPPTPSCLR